MLFSNSGLDVKLSAIVLAGSMVLSAVGLCALRKMGLGDVGGKPVNQGLSRGTPKVRKLNFPVDLTLLGDIACPLLAYKRCRELEGIAWTIAPVLAARSFLWSKVRRGHSRESFKPLLNAWEPRRCWLALPLVRETTPVALTSRQQRSTAAMPLTPPNFGNSSMS